MQSEEERERAAPPPTILKHDLFISPHKAVRDVKNSEIKAAKDRRTEAFCLETLWVTDSTSQRLNKVSTAQDLPVNHTVQILIVNRTRNQGPWRLRGQRVEDAGVRLDEYT